MLPATYSCKAANGPPDTREGWVRRGENVCYYQSAETYLKYVMIACKRAVSLSCGRHRKRRCRSAHYYVATFTYTFLHDDDEVYFAYGRPYTCVPAETCPCYHYTQSTRYSMLQDLLCSIESDPVAAQCVRRRQLTQTIAGECERRCTTDTILM